MLVDYEKQQKLQRELDFELSENFLLNGNGISFIHISQSLQSNGIGPIEFSVPYSELIEAGILDEHGALGFLLGMVNP